MASCNINKYTRPETLRSLSFYNLIKLLEKFRDYLIGVHHFEFDGCTEENFDYERLAQILFDKLFDGDTAFFSAFGLIGAMSADSKYDILRTAIAKRKYVEEMRDNMTAADLALLIYLHEPDYLSELEIKITASRRSSFTTVVCKYPLDDFMPSADQIARAEGVLNQASSQHGCGQTMCIFSPVCKGDEIQFQVRKGESFRRQGTVQSGKKSKTLGYQPESYDFFAINRKTKVVRVSITNRRTWHEPTYLQAFGLAFFNDPTAFDLQRVYALNVVKTLGADVCLCPEVPEITRITGISAKLVESDALESSTEIKSLDFFRYMKIHKRPLDGDFSFEKMTFQIEFRDGTSMTVPLENGSRAKYNYEHYGVYIDAWMTARGMIKVIDEFADNGDNDDVFEDSSEEPLRCAAM